jgi:O-antigen/teichoic acid export membrane protein
MGLLGLSGIIFMPILLRQVDAQIMASVLVSQVYVYYLLLLVQFGFSLSSPAAVARAESPFETAEVWRTSMRMKVALLMGPATASFVIGYWFLGLDAIYLVGFAFFLFASAVNSNWFLQARLEFSSGVVFAFLGVVASAFLTYWLVHKVFVSDTFLVGLCVVLIVTFPPSFLGIGSWWLSRRICIKVAPTSTEVTCWRSDFFLLWENLPLVATQLLQLVSATLGTVIVGGLADVMTTNAYAAMERLFNLSAAVIVSLYMATYPRLAILFYQNRLSYWGQAWRLLMIGGALGGVGLGVLALFGQTLLALYVSEPLAAKVVPVMLPFSVWLGLYLSQHVLTGYFVFAQRNSMVLAVNALVLLVTVGVGYPMAKHDPVLWVYGMLAGQAVAVMWLARLYHQDKRNDVNRHEQTKLA